MRVQCLLKKKSTGISQSERTGFGHCMAWQDAFLRIKSTDKKKNLLKNSKGRIWLVKWTKRYCFVGKKWSHSLFLLISVFIISCFACDDVNFYIRLGCYKRRVVISIGNVLNLWVMMECLGWINLVRAEKSLLRDESRILTLE